MATPVIVSPTLVARLRALGVTQTSWPKSAFTYFNHSEGKVALSIASVFFDNAMAISEEAATAIEQLQGK